MSLHHAITFIAAGSLQLCLLVGYGEERMRFIEVYFMRLLYPQKENLFESIGIARCEKGQLYCITV